MHVHIIIQSIFFAPFSKFVSDFKYLWIRDKRTPENFPYFSMVWTGQTSATFGKSRNFQKLFQHWIYLDLPHFLRFTWEYLEYTMTYYLMSFLSFIKSHYVKFAIIRIFSYPYFPVQGENLLFYPSWENTTEGKFVFRYILHSVILT